MSDDNRDDTAQGGVRVDYDSAEYRRFARGYDGFLSPRAAYHGAKMQEARRELRRQGISVGRNGILNQSW